MILKMGGVNVGLAYFHIFALFDSFICNCSIDSRFFCLGLIPLKLFDCDYILTLSGFQDCIWLFIYSKALLFCCLTEFINGERLRE